ncbi:hypothetical protein VTN00DRAFT_3995 [Thermoascus crustaceus]|uniref:uncharacterized protein n=1 Tax=Thermoascus crustaceus TaxID=5088 RepID=UPI003742BB8F
MTAAIGQGFVATTILPAVQAALPVKDTARATGTYAFLRSFGFIWGVTVSAIVFNAQFNAHAFIITDPMERARLLNGNAYGDAAGAFTSELPAAIGAQVIEVYRLALRTVWEVATAFALLGFLACFAMLHLDLRTEVETEFGLESNEWAVDEEADTGAAREKGASVAVAADDQEGARKQRDGKEQVEQKSRT